MALTLGSGAKRIEKILFNLGDVAEAVSVEPAFFFVRDASPWFNLLVVSHMPIFTLSH